PPFTMLAGCSLGEDWSESRAESKNFCLIKRKTMNKSRICAYIATLGPIGYLLAPGTVASAFTLPFVFWLQQIVSNEIIYGILLVILFFLSRMIVNYACDYFDQHHDPQQIVLDEVVGCLLTFWGIGFSVEAVVIGFILFRFLDISKMAGIGYVERFDNGWGIMLDDIMAGLISNIVLRLIF
ncbi:MAG: phosphatidylglycerophosphatase A, partial [bacterium]|nr:phosphatidylglycerophosphatase A [bacterium]